MRKLLLFVGFFTFTPCVLIASILLLAWHDHAKQNSFLSFDQAQNLPIAYTALPATVQQISGNIGTTDARVTKLLTFFKEHNSLLADETLVERMVTDADTYKIDYTFVPAIAMQESRGCKVIPRGSENNCWGLGIYTHHNQPYTSYAEGIDAATKTLAKFNRNGLITLEQIGSKWNPGNTNDWVGKVNYFISQIQNEPIIAYLTNL
ncbi:MAG: hypothetical protein KGJ07_06825 [Patescibacteria group bacterium]|nr:hypothetical protein [Patescibacteria group bacterium]MDE2588316.1 hypothetical protein [Patescibacteria group bacterium]